MQVEFPDRDRRSNNPTKLAANMNGVTSSYRYHLGYTVNALESIDSGSDLKAMTSNLVEYAELHTITMADAINKFYDGIFSEAKGQLREDNNQPFLNLEQAQRAIGLSYRKILEYKTTEPVTRSVGENFGEARPTWDPERLAAVYLWNIPGKIEVREAVRDVLSDRALQYAVTLDIE